MKEEYEEVTNPDGSFSWKRKPLSRWDRFLIDWMPALMLIAFASIVLFGAFTISSLEGKNSALKEQLEAANNRCPWSEKITP